jgi:hypothetical protein
MKRSYIKPKAPLTSAELQIRDEFRKYKQERRALIAANSPLLEMRGGTNSRSGARGRYHKGEWIPSKWQLNCLILLEWREKIGEITGLVSQDIIPFTVYNECGIPHQMTIEIDFCFFDKNINRPCRWDAKPPKVSHTRSGRKYPQKLHEAWLQRFELLKFCQPDFDYRILEKGNTWLDTDLNIIRD